MAPRVSPAPGEVPAYVAMSWLATYACVPETDHLADIAVAIAGVFVIEVALRWSSPLVHLGLLVVLLGAGWFGATGRASAEVGAVFALWPVVLSALFAWRKSLPTEWRFVVGAIGGVAAVAVARTGALEPTIGPALVAVAIAAPLSALAARFVTARAT